MSDSWYWKLGFSANPFSIKPAALTNKVIAHQIGKVTERIDSGQAQFIEAPLGMGKTTILKSIIAEFGGKKKLVYASCVKSERLGVESLLKNATLAGKLFGKVPKYMILLVDEAQNISKQDAEDIGKYMNEGNIRAAAFFGTHYNRKLFPEGLANSLNGNLAVLSYFTPQQAVELVRSRVGNLKLLPDYVIRELYGRTNGNPRRLLQYCEDICRKAVELNIAELTITDVGTLLKAKEPEAKQESKSKAAKQPGKKAAKRKKPRKKKSQRKKSGGRKKKAAGDYGIENIRSYEEEMGLSQGTERLS